MGSRKVLLGGTYLGFFLSIDQSIPLCGEFASTFFSERKFQSL